MWDLMSLIVIAVLFCFGATAFLSGIDRHVELSEVNAGETLVAIMEVPK